MMTTQKIPIVETQTFNPEVFYEGAPVQYRHKNNPHLINAIIGYATRYEISLVNSNHTANFSIHLDDVLAREYMLIPLIDRELPLLIDVPSFVEKLILPGSIYLMPDGKAGEGMMVQEAEAFEIKLINFSGGVFTVTPEEVTEAMPRPYLVPPPSELAYMANNQKFTALLSEPITPVSFKVKVAPPQVYTVATSDGWPSEGDIAIIKGEIPALVESVYPGDNHLNVVYYDNHEGFISHTATAHGHNTLCSPDLMRAKIETVEMSSDLLGLFISVKGAYFGIIADFGPSELTIRRSNGSYRYFTLGNHKPEDLLIIKGESTDTHIPQKETD